jgi:uncharacterized protein YjbI with pentapeptide repeats
MKERISRRQAKERWSDAAFVDATQAIIDSIVAGRAEINDADLSGISIGVEGPVRSLWGTNLYRCRLKEVDMSHSEISGSINEAELTNVSFQFAELDRCSISKSVVFACDFTSAKLCVRLDDSNVEGCSFNDCLLKGGRLGHEYGGRRVTFLNCNFTGASFRSVEFRASRFIDCVLTGTSFNGCDLRGVKFQGGIAPHRDSFRNMEVPGWAIE